MPPSPSELQWADVHPPVSLAQLEPIPARWLLTSAACLLALVVCCVLLAGSEPPLWFQPTLVGMLWGCMFLTGFAIGSFGRGSWWAASVAILLAWLLEQSCVRVTELPRADCLLLTTLLVSGGWLVARLDRAHIGAQLPAARSQPFQWSIGDLCFATTVAACFVQALLHVVPTLLLFSALLALAGGLLCSWFAYRWAWLDRWSIVSLALTAVGLLLTARVVHLDAPVDASLWECVNWFFTGPINVIASQATTVLFMLAVVRFEAASLRRALEQ